MKKLLLIALLIVGCSSEDRLHTFPFDGHFTCQATSPLTTYGSKLIHHTKSLSDAQSECEEM